MVKKDKNSHDPFLDREQQKYETPIPSREFILAELTNLGVPVKRQELLDHFSLSEDPLLTEALRRRIKAMVRDGQLLKTPEGFIPITTIETYQGVIVMEREGEGHLLNESSGSQIIMLQGPTLRGYYDGDEVEVQITQIDKQGNAKARILKLLKAATVLVIGRLLKTSHGYEVLPFDRKFSQNITIPKEKKGEAKNGDIVQIHILRDEEYRYHVEPVAQVMEVLGDFSTPGIEVKMALRKFGLPHEWSKAVLRECEKFGSQVKEKPNEHREDLTQLPLVTIDGEDAKDFDDAVFCEERRLGGWKLWVAIADVSFYVKPGSALDKEARERGNSTYFPGCVVPMLPEELSNGLCSLKPNTPRLCVVCQMSIDEQGNIIHSQFYRALMHSKARLTYTEVAEILRGHETLRETYSQVLSSLEALHDLYKALHANRKARGAIDFDTIETRILFDQSGKIKSIVPQARNVAHKMIEESMLLANVCTAKYLQRHKHVTLFRVHERPPGDKLSALRQFLSELGLDLPGRQDPTAKDFSTLLDSIQHREDKHIIETVMLRSLSQAQYSIKNVGHFGLAYPSYLHFTSPIRRYPDLMVHRAIVDVLTHKKSQSENHQALEKLAIHCSETERRSDEATRDASLALKCHYMVEKVGESFRGIISGVANFGIFVELKDIYVEGLIHVTGLGQEYFNYDAAHHRMVGDRTRKVFRLGDALEVTVVRVDVEAKKIDLELVDGPKTSRAPKTSKPSSRKPPHSKKRQRQRRSKE